MKNNIIAISIFSLGIACAAEDADRVKRQSLNTEPSDAAACALYSGPMNPERKKIFHKVEKSEEAFKAGSQQAVNFITEFMSYHMDRSAKLTHKDFYDFIVNVGNKRRDIAKVCQSEDADDFGLLRGGSSIDTPTHGYDIMTTFSKKCITNGHYDTVVSLRSTECFNSAINSYTTVASARSNMKQGSLEACKFLTEQKKISLDQAYIDSFLRMVAGSATLQPATSMYCTLFKEQDTISRFFFHFTQAETVLFSSNLYTCGTASKKSTSIEELRQLFNLFITTKKPEDAFAFFHKFAVTMPYKRGSSAVNEWILAAAFKTMDIPMPKQASFAEFDQMAQISTRDEFVALMMAKIT